jgi:uncharacterized membrane protein YccF (DUF307 family)
VKTLGNILWHFPFFGFISAAIVYLWGLLFTATVVAAPVGLGLMEFGKFLFAPFGHAMISKADLNIEQNKAWKTYSTIVTILWFPVGLFFASIAILQVFFLCMTIVGIPVALVIAKSLGTYFNPVNKKCVNSAVATELERRKGQAEVEKYLGPGDGKEQVQSAPTRSAIDPQPPAAAAQPEPSQLATAAPALSATSPEAETPEAKLDPSPDIPTEQPSPIPANGQPTPNWLIPAVAGAVILVLLAGGIIYKKTQREAELLAQQQLAAEQERTRQKEEEAQRLAEKVARLEAENRAREERQRLQAEVQQQRELLEQQQRANAELQQQQQAAQASQVSVTVQNTNCVPQDYYLSGRHVASIPAESSRSFSVAAGGYEIKVCSSNTNKCGPSRFATWGPGAITSKIHRSPKCPPSAGQGQLSSESITMLPQKTKWVMTMATKNGCEGVVRVRPKSKDGVREVFEAVCVDKTLEFTCEFSGPVSDRDGTPYVAVTGKSYQSQPACWR